MQPVEEFSYVVWLALYDIPQLSIVKLSLKFLVNKGVSIYDDLVFWQVYQSEEIPGRSQR
jgi:hypothetical protein